MKSAQSGYGPISNTDTTQGIIGATASILMHFDSSVTADAVGTYTWTGQGPPTISNTSPKFGAGCVSFAAATGQRITTPYAAAIDIGLLTTWTVEAWVWLVGNQSSIGSNRLTIFGKGTGSNGWEMGITSTGLNITYPGVAAYTTTVSISSGAWHHIAFCRNGTSTAYLAVDGVVQTVTLGSALGNTSQAMQIGSNSLQGNNDISFFIDELRVVIGAALYTANYVVPTAAYSSAFANSFGSLADLYYYTTALLMHGDGVNSGTVFTESAKGLTISRTGTGIITSTSQAKFGATSMSFPGGTSTDVLSTPSSANFALGTSDFTIDFWVYANSQTAANPVMIGNYNTTPFTTNAWGIYWGNGVTNAISFWAQNINGGAAVMTTAAQSTGAWHHVALVRRGSNFTIYVDGVSAATASSATSIDAATASSLFLGRGNNTTTTAFLGFLDEVRVSRMARWTADFTPPASAYASLL